MWFILFKLCLCAFFFLLFAHVHAFCCFAFLHSQVHVFDPTVTEAEMAVKSAEGGYTFHMFGLGSQAQSDRGTVLKYGPLYTLHQVMEQLG